MSLAHYTAGVLTDIAHHDLIETLKGYGSEPSRRHSEVLKDLLTDYSKTALGLQSGRIAWPIAVGGGKSQSVASFIAACSKTTLREVSVMVAQEKVEALCDLKRDLRAKGVPEVEICLSHSYLYDKAMAEAFLNDGVPLKPGYASAPSTQDHADRRYLLLTHQKLKSARDVHDYNTFNGLPRSLVIWDESLVKARGNNMNPNDITSGLFMLQGRTDTREGVPTSHNDQLAHKAAQYMEYCLHTLELANGKGVDLRAKTAEEIDAFKAAIRAILGRGVRGTNDVHADILCDFLSFTQDTIRLVKTSQGNGLITYDLLIPNSLQNLVILDASHVIRKLIHYDRTIKQAPNYRPVKSFSNVRVRQLKYRGGRNTLKKMKAGDPLITTLGDDLASISDDRGIIIYTMKQRSKKEPDYQKLILSELKRRGIDTEAMVDVEVNGQTVKKRRINLSSWGNETGLSKFSHCSHVLAVGIYRRSFVDLSASMAGQMETLDGYELDNHANLTEILRTELFHSLFQAFGRGSMRVTIDGMAKEMTASFVAWECFQDLFEKTMPGVVLEAWTSPHIHKAGRRDKAAQLITDGLKELPFDVPGISVKRIRGFKGCTNIAPSTFRDAVTQVGETLRGWRKVGRSLVRC